MCIKYEDDTRVYVNGRPGTVLFHHVVDGENHYNVKFETGYEGSYPESQLLKKWRHCKACNRRLNDDYPHDKCGYCRHVEEKQ